MKQFVFSLDAARRNLQCNYQWRVGSENAHHSFDERVNASKVLSLLGTCCDATALHDQRFSVWCVYAFDPLPNLPQLKNAIGGGVIWSCV